MRNTKNCDFHKVFYTLRIDIWTIHSYMKKNLRATSIIEAIIVMLLVVTGIVWLYNIFIESQELSETTENRIIAIQIAREGIEAMTNIRDTNWFLFRSDSWNCWNTLNYNNNCIAANNTTYDILVNRSFTMYQWGDNKWRLNLVWNNETRNFTNSGYRNDYRVRQDANGFYTQNGGTDFAPLFTREIRIGYVNTNGWSVNSQDEKMIVESIVRWSDWWNTPPREVRLETMLSNWKY